MDREKRIALLDLKHRPIVNILKSQTKKLQNYPDRVMAQMTGALTPPIVTGFYLATTVRTIIQQMAITQWLTMSSSIVALRVLKVLDNALFTVIMIIQQGLDPGITLWI